MCIFPLFYSQLDPILDINREFRFEIEETMMKGTGSMERPTPDEEVSRISLEMAMASDPSLMNHHSNEEGSVGTSSTITETFASAECSLLENVEEDLVLEDDGDGDCPFLQGVLIDELPPRFRRIVLLSPSKDDFQKLIGMEEAFERRESSLDFYPGHIPSPPRYSIFLAFLSINAARPPLAFLANGTDHVVLCGLWALLYICLTLLMIFQAYTNHKKRAPLFAWGYNAKIRWFHGRWEPALWKAGTYLVGRSALLDFDGSKAWLFPIDSIACIEYNPKKPLTTHVVLRLPNSQGQTLRHKLDHGDSEPHKGPMIEWWHQRSIRFAKYHKRRRTKKNSLSPPSSLSMMPGDLERVVKNKVVYPNGTGGTYTGAVARSTGMPQGFGRMVYEKDHIYEGDWHDGQKHGYGRSFYAHGGSYEGDYVFGQEHGTGVSRRGDGMVYHGGFSKGGFHGVGMICDPSNGNFFRGYFVHGKQQGPGMWSTDNGGLVCEGSVKDKKLHGFGARTLKNGTRLYGEWQNGKLKHPSIEEEQRQQQEASPWC